jgi:hypothetical protein
MNHHPAWSYAMSAQRSVPVPSDRPAPRRPSLARPGLALLTGALALTLAACGGGSTTPAASSPTSTHAARPSGANTPPGTFGTAAAVAATSLEVQNQQSGQVTVNFTAATKFTNTVTSTLAAVKVGTCVSVTSTSGGMQAKTLTATSVAITAAGAKGCTEGGFGGGAGAGAGGGGGFGGRPGGGAGGAGGASRQPNPSRQPRPSGANGPGGAGNFGRAFGAVSAVSATGFTVHGVARGSTPATDTVVTVTPTTSYTQSGSATSKALAVGQCIAAIGKADDTGAVAATTIAISKAGPNGCTAGFGGGRGGFGGRGNGGGQGGTGTGGGNG